ncbi:PepSY domain-containing protein [Limnobacter parvus]|uniref:PepSY domain-containing protein n=1 Tax=Limnobacter parvus TaxID=2939690 RepID=A0ABT1XE32_9BURK|nr:PepSY domain-containing protein [Limnobacter parvus]MCR2745394.1 PepSY domain-containing protein [Limnobacter parvus]
MVGTTQDTRPKFKVRMLKLHRTLAWLGFAALLLWGGSGLLHSWLTLFGVQQAVFAAPQRELNLAKALPFDQILAKAGVEKAAAVKVVVGEADNLLQVTEQALQARRYFSLETSAELPNHDKVYAAFLARHYLNLHYENIRSIEWIDQFSDDYHPVNRLLPVYRVSFDRDDGLNALVYTETGALAGVSNHTKQRVQTAFQWFHTWSWVPNMAETPRIVVMGVLVGALVLMSLTGLSMLILIRRRTRAAGAKGWHRLAAYVLVLPVFMFSFSGVYHLLQHGWPNNQSHLALNKPMQLNQFQFPVHAEWATLTDKLVVSGFSLIADEAGTTYYRLALPLPKGQVPTDPQTIRNARFDGIQATGPALYVHTRTGEPWSQGDRELAFQLAAHHTGLPREAVQSATLITRFGPDYDFRNKRLPVWKFEYGAPLNASVFIDTATGVMADQTLNSAKPESISFSMLHKWNFMFPLGRQIQNWTIAVVTVLSIVLLAGFGIRSRFR